MAKGQDTVGRPPRPRPPVKIVRPRTPVYIGGSNPDDPEDISGLTFYPEAKDDEVTPYSERVKAPGGKYGPTYKEALENIDKVHTYKARRNPVLLKTANLRGRFYGDYEPRTGTRVTEEGDREIVQYGKVRVDAKIQLESISRKEGGVRATTTHELGHNIDRMTDTEPEQPDLKLNVRNYESEKAFRAMGPLPKSQAKAKEIKTKKTDSPWVKWGKAVVKTDAYWDLQRAKKRSITVDPLLPSGRTIEKKPSATRLSYLESPVELFARSYTQYIGEKTEDKGLLASVHATRRKGASAEQKKFYKGQSWTKQDFKSVSAALDEIFESEGLLVHD